MSSAKKLGYAVGQLVWTGSFPAVIVGDVHTTTPTCEVWGVEQETGSVYAKDLAPLKTAGFIEEVQVQGHTLPLKPHSERAYLGLIAAGVPCDDTEVYRG